MERRPELYAYLLAALAIICATALAMTGQEVPDFLEFVAGVAVGGGAGVSVGSRGARRASDPPAAE